MLLLVSLFAAAQAPAGNVRDPGYIAGWVAVAQPQPIEVRIAEKGWKPVAGFRPAVSFALDSDAIEAGKSKPMLRGGTAMIGIANHERVACELERPRGDYFVGCVQDKDGDGRFETFFELNHANPFLFSALRQPRHKDRPIAPVSLTRREAGGAPVEMMLVYRNRAELSGISQFELCVLRPDNRNIWGDKMVARGCLPPVSIGDGDFPRRVEAYGRTIEFRSRNADGALVSISGAVVDIPVRL
ncbi:MAG: hypothetical protein ACO1O3_06950 [Sphingobium sp.]